jgi:predicted DNA-binding transcriptional regulator AlpA
MDGLKIMEQLERIEKLVRAGKNVLSLEEASEYTGISRSYLYKLTARGIFLSPNPEER